MLLDTGSVSNIVRTCKHILGAPDTDAKHFQKFKCAKSFHNRQSRRTQKGITYHPRALVVDPYLDSPVIAETTNSPTGPPAIVLSFVYGRLTSQSSDRSGHPPTKHFVFSFVSGVIIAVLCFD